MVREVSEDTFEANRLTETLSINGYRAGMNQTYHSLCPPSLSRAPSLSLTHMTYLWPFN